MARKPRIEYEGAFYHVITRGNQRQRIFKDKHDYLKYLEILSKYKLRHQFSLYSYVLMGNHIHLLIETKHIPLSKTLQGVNQSYTMYFNRRYRTVGHLFQGRYKSILCDRDEYLLSLIKYIHFNPVRAKITKDIQDYIWSSHKYYLGRKENYLIDVERVLRMFSENKTTSRKLYRHFMGDGIAVKKETIYNTVDQMVLGREEFLDNVMEKYDGELNKEKREQEYTLSEIAKGLETVRGVTLNQVHSQSKLKEISLSRKLFILVAIEYGYRGKEIAKFLRRDPAVISQALKENNGFDKDVKMLIEALKYLNN